MISSGVVRVFASTMTIHPSPYFGYKMPGDIICPLPIGTLHTYAFETIKIRHFFVPGGILLAAGCADYRIHLIEFTDPYKPKLNKILTGHRVSLV